MSGTQHADVKNTKYKVIFSLSEQCEVKSDIGTEQNDIHVDMRNVRLVRSATRVHKRCSCVLVQCEAGPVKSKIKVKFMENLWLIV